MSESTHRESEIFPDVFVILHTHFVFRDTSEPDLRIYRGRPYGRVMKNYKRSNYICNIKLTELNMLNSNL